MSARRPIPVGGALSGLLLGVSVLVLLQQFAVRPLTTSGLVVALVGGLVVGTGLPFLVGLAVRPQGPTAPDAPVAGAPGGGVPGPEVPAAAPLAGAPAPPGSWAATHRTGHEVVAYPAPDPGAAPIATLASSIEVRVVEMAGDWAHVDTADGHHAWVDARALEPRH